MDIFICSQSNIYFSLKNSIFWDIYINFQNNKLKVYHSLYFFLLSSCLKLCTLFGAHLVLLLIVALHLVLLLTLVLPFSFFLKSCVSEEKPWTCILLASFTHFEQFLFIFCCSVYIVSVAGAVQLKFLLTFSITQYRQKNIQIKIKENCLR